MKFAMKPWSSSGARSGLLQLGSCPTPFETPCLLLSTRKGLPHFISPDLLLSLPSPDSNLLQLCPLHFHETVPTKTISKLGGVHKMLGLHEYEFAAVLRDSIQCIPDAKSTNKYGASFDTPNGRCLVKPVDYIAMISSMRPNSWVSLPDEVPVSASEKRHKTSVDRTIKWLDECIALNPADRGALFGAIVGGSSIEERKRCAHEVATRNVSGYWLGGFGLGESMEERPALFKTITDCLPMEKPRQISGLGLPEEVLQGVAAGLDLFDSAYIYNTTIGGLALIFPTDETEFQTSRSWSSDLANDLTTINLGAAVYRKDTSPIIDNCRCHTCKNHTKAYIHHLLNVKEMLAYILLEIHNTHHYLRFFRSIREAIKAGEFEQFHRNFFESRPNRLSFHVARS